jgi:glycosyltransferase involved in cell wall biosynthesis
MTTNRSVLFVSHDSFRGGATVLLNNFLRWLKENTDISFQILVCQRGEMEAEFEKLAPVWYLDARITRRVALRASIRRLVTGVGATNVLGFGDLAARIGAASRINLVYSNTVVNGRVLEALSPLGCPVLTHVHELEFLIHTNAGKDFERVKRYTDHFVAVSDAVRSNLVARHGIPEAKIERIYGSVPTTARPRADPVILKRALATEIGIPENARIVGGCGSVYWLKGCDLFVQLAVALRAREPSVPIHLVWLGMTPPSEGFYPFQHDLVRAGLVDRVHFIGSRRNPLDYIAAFDVLALVSREEAFPLTVMEAAAVGVPTVCFDAAGGAREFVEADAGRVLPYLDMDSMAACVLELLRDDEQRRRLGRRARTKVQEQYDISVMAPKLVRTIDRMLATGGESEAPTRRFISAKQDLR